MMAKKFRIYDKAEELPLAWDQIADHPFQKRSFLSFLEKVNPCDQRYHLNESAGILLVTYRLWLDVFTFTKAFCVKMPITIAGIPLSIACPGYCSSKEGVGELSRYLKKFGGILVLNSDGELDLPKGRTLPSFELVVESLDKHILQMRSHYRYRINKAIQKGKTLSFEKIDPSCFDEELYRLYEEVHERSEGKLEKLNIDFFRKCDADLYRVRTKGGKVLAFFQTKEIEEELIFLFCGFDHTQNKFYDLYINILLKILSLGQGKKKILLGQTTEYSKCRVGANPKDLYLHIGSRYIPDLLLRKIVSYVEHRGLQKQMHCMKNQGVDFEQGFDF